MRLSRPTSVALACAAILAAAPRPGAFGDPPTSAPAPPPAGDSKPVHRVRPLTPKERADAVAAFHKYLDLSSDKSYEARLQLLDLLKALADAGEDLLADLDTLQGILYAARTFANPPFARKYIPKDKDEAKKYDVRDSEAVPGVVNVKWDAMRLSLSIPKSYPVADPKKVVEHAPWPLLVTLHEAEDFMDAKGPKPWPGEEVLRRRWDPRGPMKAVPEEWFVFAPVVTRAKFTTDDGAILPETVPVHETWQRYHVDFDRLVIEGGSDALAFAASRAMFYAGVIVRGDKADVAPALVRNFAGLSVYVVGSDASAALKSLKAGGFPMEQVKVGGADGLPEWLKGVRRKTPTSFHWTVGDRKTMSGAHWVAIAQPEEAAEAPTLDVEVVDTADDPNTVRLKTRLVRLVTLYLSDRIVDLDRPVRVVVNGKELKSAAAVTDGRDNRPMKLPARLERRLDVMFDVYGQRVRRSQYFGWLYPAGLEDIRITDDAEAPGGAAMAPAPGGGAAPTGDSAEANAQRYFQKAQQCEKDGKLDQAKRLYQRVLDEGESTVKALAEARLKELSR